ncbi:MAG: LTA synthase family protein [Eubacteriales bacterium]|uniref:LTA synthase family protein n=1 Tax=Fenollaria sp. TaxID=1965292 RepID=UPI002A764D51|nr:LTA synthase family protein [Fenollaria sp.]MDD7340096.1 LTA synthase family protein [Eubacteriales bacterium]MDY3105936.1 LTA synthase family protein [Fenollaria sp.]
MKKKRASIVICIVFIINILFYYKNFIYKLALDQRPRLILLTLAIILTSAIELAVLFAFTSRVYRAAVIALAGFAKIGASVFYAEFANFDLFSRLDQAKELKGTGPVIRKNISVFLIVIIILSLINIAVVLRSEKKKGSVKRSAIGIGLAALLIIAPQYLYGSIFGTELYSTIAMSKLKRIVDERAMYDESIEMDVAREFRERKFTSNDFTGLAKGKNIIVIQCESLQNTFVNKEYNGEEITPFMNSLIKDEGSIYFDNYFELLGMGNTSDAEFVSLNGLYPSLKGQAYKLYEGCDNCGLFTSAKDHGYRTMAFHGNTGKFYDRRHFYEELGVDDIMLGEEFTQDEIINMGLSDKSFFKQSLVKYKDAAQNGDKFFSFMITLTTHTPFILPEELASIKPLPGDEDDYVYRYAKCARYTDEAIESFFKDLDELGLLDDTVIVIYGDHHAMTVKNAERQESIKKWLGKELDYDEMMNIPLVIRVPGYKGNTQRHNIGSQLDLYATLINLLDWDKTKYPNMGVDLLDDEASKDNIVFPLTHLDKGSFITDDTLFVYPRDRIFDHGRYIDRKTRKELPIAEAKELSKRAVITTNYGYGLATANKLLDLVEKTSEKDKSTR